ncbi:type II secretion system F family protein [Homoserinimonas sp. OAct 916]|uniref:type II secretion system F family protein n=1 Tax=Homoserinimonas sp. OAct 916 TaxID=2211450 RepID=UPI000DBE2D14|nr:type II secretion system F family protein [Homoserinimonas sp. OAct 916]
MTALAAWGVVCGTVLGLGLWSLVSMMPSLRRPRLADRLAPYLLDVSSEARIMVSRATVNPLPVIGGLFAPVARRARLLLAAAVGSAEPTILRLAQAGSSVTLEEYRSRQLVWGLAGCGAGLLVAAGVGGSAPTVVYLLAPVLGGVLGVLTSDRWLQRMASARIRRIAAELPTVLEFLTLSLSAGDGVVGSLRRVSEVSTGELAAEFRLVLADVNTGVPLGAALSRLAARVRLPALSRCVEQLIGALDRGTPLSEVLRAQAQDSRDETKRDLLEMAGKKEVAMLVPLVFLILPATIIFAIFPGIHVLRAGF